MQSGSAAPDAQCKIERFRHEYLTEHSPSSLGGLTPTEYAGRFIGARSPSCQLKNGLNLG